MRGAGSESETRGMYLLHTVFENIAPHCLDPKFGDTLLVSKPLPIGTLLDVINSWLFPD